MRSEEASSVELRLADARRAGWPSARLYALGRDPQGVAWLISERHPPDLGQALRERLNVRLRDIGVALLRFYDPTLLQGILTLLSPSQRASFVAPALQWLVERDGQLVQLSPEKLHA